MSADHESHCPDHSAPASLYLGLIAYAKTSMLPMHILQPDHVRGDYRPEVGRPRRNMMCNAGTNCKSGFRHDG